MPTEIVSRSRFVVQSSEKTRLFRAYIHTYILHTYSIHQYIHTYILHTYTRTHNIHHGLDVYIMEHLHPQDAEPLAATPPTPPGTSRLLIILSCSLYITGSAASWAYVLDAINSICVSPICNVSMYERNGIQNARRGLVRFIQHKRK
jgi:hypothetical protein